MNYAMPTDALESVKILSLYILFHKNPSMPAQITP